ncbi:MAG: hypothetical protein ACXVCY_04100 [Pseudobdellovibrionaceae bacterium]
MKTILILFPILFSLNSYASSLEKLVGKYEGNLIYDETVSSESCEVEISDKLNSSIEIQINYDELQSVPVLGEYSVNSNISLTVKENELTSVSTEIKNRGYSSVGVEKILYFNNGDDRKNIGLDKNENLKTVFLLRTSRNYSHFLFKHLDPGSQPTSNAHVACGNLTKVY